MAIEVDDPNGSAAMPLSPLSNGSSDGQAAVLETLSAQLTWLDGELIEFAKQAPGILSAQVVQQIRSLCARGRALLRHQAESTPLRAGLELRRRATGQKAVEAFDGNFVEDLIQGFEQCSSMRVRDPYHVLNHGDCCTAVLDIRH